MNEQGVDRVLATRLESVRHILLGLKGLSQDVKEARRGLDDLDEQVAQLGVALTRVTRKIGTVQNEVAWMATSMGRYEDNGKLSYIVKAADLSTQAEELTQLKQVLEQLEDDLNVRTGKSVTAMRRWAPLSQPSNDIDVTLKRLAIELGATLAETEGQPDPWSYYAGVVRSQCDDLFAQYVDLVGGIAMRDHGLDRQVSPAADRLVHELTVSFGGSDATMAVPSRHTTEALIHAQHVRIPLPPGWTLWSLPLLARGAGELLLRSLNVQDEWADLVPDVFGVYVAGPAYVLASVLIELDPAQPQARLRARVMFEALRTLGADDDRDRFGRLADEIGAEWDRAASAVRGEGEADEPVADDAVTAAFRLVEQVCADGVFLPKDRWDDVTQLARRLGGEEETEGQANDFRDLLNAMWLARWNHPGALDDIDARSAQEAQRLLTGRESGRAAEQRRSFRLSERQGTERRP
jgi:hypothetical protein